jgi:hypothetical protein
LTVCLAVLGKYVRSLSVFGTLLADEPALEPEVKFYQRLVALDQDGANEIWDALIMERPRVEVFDSVLIPALARAQRDHVREAIDNDEVAFIMRTISDLLDDLDGAPAITITTPNGKAGDGTSPSSAKVIGVAANGHAEALILRMVALEVEPIGATLEILTDTESPLRLSEWVAESTPRLVLLSHLPPSGLTRTRYLVKRLRARLADLPIIAGRWGEPNDVDNVTEKLKDAGANRVVFSVADARDAIREFLARNPARRVEPISVPSAV